MTEFTNSSVILDEIDRQVSQARDSHAKTFSQIIAKSNRIFILGEGYSEFIANRFTMRLNQLGKNSYLVSKLTQLEIDKRDLIVIISNSDLIKYLRILTEQPRFIESKAVLLTKNTISKSSNIVGLVIELQLNKKDEFENLLLDNLFGQTVQIFLDSIVLDLVEILKINKNTK